MRSFHSVADPLSLVEFTECGSVKSNPRTVHQLHVTTDWQWVGCASTTCAPGPLQSPSQTTEDPPQKHPRLVAGSREAALAAQAAIMSTATEMGLRITPVGSATVSDDVRRPSRVTPTASPVAELAGVALPRSVLHEVADEAEAFLLHPPLGLSDADHSVYAVCSALAIVVQVAVRVRALARVHGTGSGSGSGSGSQRAEAVDPAHEFGRRDPPRTTLNPSATIVTHEC